MAKARQRFKIGDRVIPNDGITIPDGVYVIIRKMSETVIPVYVIEHTDAEGGSMGNILCEDENLLPYDEQTYESVIAWRYQDRYRRRWSEDIGQYPESV